MMDPRNRIVIPTIWGYILLWSLFQIWAIFWAPPAWSQIHDPNHDQSIPPGATGYHPPDFSTRGVLLHDAPPGAAWYARVEMNNWLGGYFKTETHQTEHGDVLIEYWTSPGGAAYDEASSDTACVVMLPDGVIAQPPCVTILEQERESIFLLLFTGG